MIRPSAMPAEDWRQLGIPQLDRTVGTDGKSRPSGYRYIDRSPEGERSALIEAKDIRARKAEIRRAERIERLAATCNQSTPFPSDRPYAVLYADPPWHFNVYNEESGTERAAGNHYSAMSLDEICALPILSLASPDAALFMWTTVPHLRKSFDVLVSGALNTKRISCG